MGRFLVKLSGSYQDMDVKELEFNDGQYFCFQVIFILRYQGEVIIFFFVLLLYVFYNFIVVFILAYYVIVLSFIFFYLFEDFLKLGLCFIDVFMFIISYSVRQIEGYLINF